MATSIIFSRGEGPGSTVSRILQISPWDRVAIDFKDGFICELSKWDGVRIHSRAVFHGLLGKHIEVEVDLPSRKRCIDYIRKNTHIRYGWLNLFRLPTTKQYRNDNMLPSEFVAGALKAGNMSLRFDTGLVSPVRLWLALLANNPDIRY